MTFTYDLSTDIGKFRAIFPDTVAANPLFSDEEITIFLDLEGDLRRARARGLERAASDLVLTLRVTETLGLKVDGAAAGRELRMEAEAERDRAAKDEGRGEALFDWAEMVYPNDPFSEREYLAADALRSGL